jgi:hypothetical protein
MGCINPAARPAAPEEDACILGVGWPAIFAKTHSRPPKSRVRLAMKAEKSSMVVLSFRVSQACIRVTSAAAWAMSPGACGHFSSLRTLSADYRFSDQQFSLIACDGASDRRKAASWWRRAGRTP